MAENESQKIITSVEQDDFTYPIGVEDSAYVKITRTKEVGGEEVKTVTTLQDFYDNWENFKEENIFAYWGEGSPEKFSGDIPDNIKIWYDTTTPSSSSNEENTGN